MTCKDCIHYEICDKDRLYCEGNDEDEAERCVDFSDKSEWVHLPCKVGGTVYVLWQTANGDYKVLKDEIWRFTVGEIGLVIESEYIEYGKFGQDVFLTRKEAEKALAEREKANDNT